MADVELTTQIIEDIQQAVQSHEPEAGDGVVMQYLAAVLGYMVATQRAIPSADHEALLQELSNFARHVCRDVTSSQEQGELKAES